MTGVEALKAASAVMDETLAAFRASQNTTDSFLGRWLTDTEPVPSATVVALVDNWKAKVRAVNPADGVAVNKLIASGQDIVNDLRQKVGLSADVTLSGAVVYVAKESAKDIGEISLGLRAWLPWVAGAATVLVLVALFLRVRGR